MSQPASPTQTSPPAGLCLMSSVSSPGQMSQPASPCLMSPVSSPGKMLQPASPYLMSPVASSEAVPSTPVLFASPLITPVREARKMLTATPQQTSTPAMPKRTKPKPSKSKEVRRMFVPKDEHLTVVQLGERLSDIHITAALQLIQKEFLDLDECQNSLLSQLNQFVPMIKERVRFYFINSHWATSLNIYDSAYSGKLCTDHPTSWLKYTSCPLFQGKDATTWNHHS